MNKFLIVLILALVACKIDFDALVFQHFQKFIKKYNKKYQSIDEFLARYEVFKTNIMKAFKEEKKYRTGITKFSDLTKEEFAKAYFKLNYNSLTFSNLKPTKVEVTNDAPDSWDWRDQGVVSVRELDSCNPVIYFSTIDNLQALYAINKGSLTPLSAQMLLDCDVGGSACTGGYIDEAYNWLVENGGGLMTEADYPYEGTQGTCRYDSSKDIDMRVTGYDYYVQETEDKLKEVLYETGPLYGAINADPLQTYTGGIIDLDESECPATGIDYPTLLVGYGNEDGKDYWICMNYWGPDWGENGFFRIVRGKNCCGISTVALTGKVTF